MSEDLFCRTITKIVSSRSMAKNRKDKEPFIVGVPLFPDEIYSVVGKKFPYDGNTYKVLVLSHISYEDNIYLANLLVANSEYDWEVTRSARSEMWLKEFNKPLFWYSSGSW